MLGCCGRIVGDRERSRECVGEAVVAVDASDLFDEVDLALEVEPPGGQLDLVDVEAMKERLAAERGEVAGDDLAGDAIGLSGGAEMAAHLIDREVDGGAACCEEEVRPMESCGVSVTSAMKLVSGAAVPVKTCPCSKRRTSRTSRLRLWASIVSMPGASTGRRREASSESGFSMATARFVGVCADSGR